MAAANDVEDLVTCGVCLCEYDDVNRKPKFLQCAHTVCLSCLKKIVLRQEDLITCPFCRQSFVTFDVASLPNNPYALHMLKFNEKHKPNPVEVVVAPLEVHWCLTCESAEKEECSSSGHSSVNMTVSTIKNLEGLLKLKEELLAMKDTGTNKLAMAIQERQKVQEQLALVMKSIQCSGEQVQKLQEENDLRMTEMVSILERSKSNEEVEKKELFFSELMALVPGSTADDTTETLKLKMTNLVEFYDQKHLESVALASQFEIQKKVKIAVHLYDEKDQPIKTLPMLENGFRFNPLSPVLKGSATRQDSILLSHAVFSLLQRQEIVPLKVEEAQQTVDTNTKFYSPKLVSCIGTKVHYSWETPTGPVNFQYEFIDSKKKQKNATKIKKKTKVASKSASLVSPPNVFPSSSTFVLSLSTVFILRLFQSGNLKGEIHIMPVFRLPWISEFMQKLGEFCFKSQKMFSNTIDKVFPGGFVLFLLNNQQFQPEISCPIGTDGKPTYDLVADQVNEVGITLLKTSSGKITGWSFVFPLEEFRNPKNEVHVKKVSANEFFGRVIDQHMLEPISKLSLTSKSERTGYTITIECQ